MFKKKDDAEGEEKADGDDKEDKEEEEEEDSDDEEEEEVEDKNADEFDENGQPYSDRAIRWSIQNFGDKSGTRFFKHVGDRNAKDIKEMQRKRLWRVTLKNVFYTHEYTGPENDIFLQFNVGYDFRLTKRSFTQKDATGKKRKRIITVPSGTLGDVRRSPYKQDLPLHETVSFASLESTFTQEHSYMDLYEKNIRVEVWDKESMWPNSFLGEMQMPMVSVARGGLNNVWPISNNVTQSRKTVVTPVGVVSFVCIFQEVLDFELRLQNWSAKIEARMLAENVITALSEAEVASKLDDDDDDEHIRYPYLVFRLGGLTNLVQGFKNSVIPEDINPQAAVSKITTVSYPHDAEYVLPTFRTTDTLRFRGTRSELEDQDLNIRVYTRRGTGVAARRLFRPKYVGEGSVSLEGASTGVSTTTPIAWRRKGRHTSGLIRFVPAGRVTGSVSVSARQSTTWKDKAQFWRNNHSGESPLWREFCQTGSVQPAELKVYKPFEYCYLCIKVIRCIGLLAVDEDGASDPYVSMTWAGQTQSTTVRFDNCDPEYNETFFFRVRASDPDMPTSAELEKHPFVRFSVWDYDESGSSDDLGTGKIYLHNITGAWNKDDDVDDTFKPNVPTKREVMIRDRATGPLRQRTIMTRSYTSRVKLEGLPPHLESAIKVEAWFHGPGYVDETRKPQIYSTTSKEQKLKRAGDLLEPDKNSRKERGSPLLYLRKWDPDSQNIGHAHEMEAQTRQDVEKFWARIYEGSLSTSVKERITDMNSQFPILEAVDQYGQKFLLPQFLQAIPVPAQLFAKDNGYEQSRSVCIDSQKPQTCWNIARFVQIIEWVFENDNDRDFTDQIGGADSWVSPEYVFDMKKTGVTGHVLVMCSMFLGLKVDAWVCVGRARIEDSDETKHHAWVMTRESTSTESLYTFGKDELDLQRKGAVKFWESTDKQMHVIPVLANRWEGLDEDEAFNDATGVRRKKKKKKKKKEEDNTDELKMADEDIVEASDSDSDNDQFLMEDADMLAYDHGSEFDMVERGDMMFGEKQVFVESAGMAAHGGGGFGAAWSQWGRPDAQEELKANAKANSDERDRLDAEKLERARIQEQAKMEAMTQDHAERIAWIENNNSYAHMQDKCVYTELHAVFNSTQLFVNIQESCHPLTMGYDFEFGAGGGWEPLFRPAPRIIDDEQGGVSKKAKAAAELRKENLTRPNKGVLLSAACRLVSLGPPTSQDHVAENRGHIITSLMASITNYRHGRNLETRWEGNESLRPYLQRAILARLRLKKCAKVPKNGWRPRAGKWMQYFPGDEPEDSETKAEENKPFGPNDIFGFMQRKAWSTISVQSKKTSDRDQEILESKRYSKGWFLNRGALLLVLMVFFVMAVLC